MLKVLTLFIDHKCFAVVDFTAISRSLEYFGLGKQFINYVMLLFADFELCTQNMDLYFWLAETAVWPA